MSINMVSPKKVIAAAMSLLLIVSLFSACSDDGAGSTAETSTAQGPAPVYNNMVLVTDSAGEPMTKTETDAEGNVKSFYIYASPETKPPATKAPVSTPTTEIQTDEEGSTVVVTEAPPTTAETKAPDPADPNVAASKTGAKALSDGEFHIIFVSEGNEDEASEVDLYFTNSGIRTNMEFSEGKILGVHMYDNKIFMSDPSTSSYTEFNSFLQSMMGMSVEELNPSELVGELKMNIDYNATPTVSSETIDEKTYTSYTYPAQDGKAIFLYEGTNIYAFKGLDTAGKTNVFMQVKLLDKINGDSDIKVPANYTSKNAMTFFGSFM